MVFSPTLKHRQKAEVTKELKSFFPFPHGRCSFSTPSQKSPKYSVPMNQGNLNWHYKHEQLGDIPQTIPKKKWHFSASLTCSRNLWLKTNERLSMLKRNNRNLSMAWDRTASQLSHAYFEISQKQPPWFHINLHTHVNKSMLHISQRRHMGEFHIPTAAFQGEKHHPGISLAPSESRGMLGQVLSSPGWPCR